MNEETLHLLAEIVPKDYESEDDTGLDDWLQARERLNQEGVFPWPFRRPYRVLGEAHLPQEKLPQLWAKEGFYRQG